MLEGDAATWLNIAHSCGATLKEPPELNPKRFSSVSLHLSLHMNHVIVAGGGRDTRGGIKKGTEIVQKLSARLCILTEDPLWFL
jgi:hypothetical protein